MSEWKIGASYSARQLRYRNFELVTYYLLDGTEEHWGWWGSVVLHFEPTPDGTRWTLLGASLRVEPALAHSGDDMWLIGATPYDHLPEAPVPRTYGHGNFTGGEWRHVDPYLSTRVERDAEWRELQRRRDPYGRARLRARPPEGSTVG